MLDYPGWPVYGTVIPGKLPGAWGVEPDRERGTGMVESTGGRTLGSDGEASEPPEPPTTLIAASGDTPAEPATKAAEPPTNPMTPEPPTRPMAVEPPPAEDEAQPPRPRSEPVWPGLTAAGLPTRVPRRGDEEAIREAFAASWEAGPTSPTPLTRKPFTPTYLTEPPRQRSWGTDFDPAALLGAATTGTEAPDSPQPPDPREPPKPPEPPDPKEPPKPPEPPEPKEPPKPPTPPGPSPFPAPSPVPTPPEPVRPSPVPSPVPPGPPPGPVPTPPPPFPPPPPPVPPPPAIVPGATPVASEASGRIADAEASGRPGAPTRPRTPRTTIGASTYQGGGYAELKTEPITGVVATDGGSIAPEPRSGSLTGHLLSRNQELYRRRERRRKVKSVLWVVFGLLMFATGIAVVVNMLAGDFIRSMFATFSDWAG